MTDCITCGQEIKPFPRRTRVLHYWGPSSRQDGASLYLYHAMRRFPKLWSEHYELVGDPRLNGKSDLNIEVDWAGDAYGKNGFFIPSPNFYWVSDSHFTPDSYKARMDRAKMFGVVATNIKDHVADFAKQGPRAFWLPYAAEPTCYRPLEIERVRDWCFIGHSRNYPEREDFIDGLIKALPDHLVERQFFEIANTSINSSRIAVNHTMTDYSTNMRTFELLASGTFSIHKHTRDLGELGLTPGYNIVTFRDLDECVDKMCYYLKHYDEAEKIAKRGLQTVLAGHTYVHRAITILRECGLWKAVEDITEEDVKRWNAPKTGKELAKEYMEKQKGEK